MTTQKSFSTASKEYQKGQYRQALLTLNKLLESQQDAKTYALLAKTLLKVGLRSDAAASYELAAKYENPNATEYRRQAMKLHFECGNDDEALLVGKQLLEVAPSDPEVAYVLASIFLKRGQRDVVEGLRKALAYSSNPDHLALAGQLLTDKSHDENDYLTALRLLQQMPGNNRVRAIYLVHCREFNDYPAIAKHQPIIEAALAKGDTTPLTAEAPWHNITWCEEERTNRMAVGQTIPPSPGATERRRSAPHNWSDKIRIGYLSADFCDQHATMKLLRNVLERHDRNRFEVTLFCHTPTELLNHNIADRAAWGHVVPVSDLSDEEAARAIRAREIDILVDLKGHTMSARPAIFNQSAAPLQIAWLGFPGSTVNIDLDYVIGDRFVLPETSKPHYHEKFCRLPDSYQPNDPVNRPRLQPLSRSELELPEDTFIFASFNHNRKISPACISLWTRILKRAKNSHLMLLTDSERAMVNIRSKLKAEGISQDRVIFTPKVDYAQHLNRQQAADLGLDTFPVNGHTTTSEQLWGGLPVITVKGTNFASRVSESLLNAIGLPELVAEDSDAYVELAVSCYENPDKVAAYKAKLEQNRFVAPLFDSERFCRHLEAAYAMMVDRAKKGLDPDHFDVPTLPARVEPFM